MTLFISVIHGRDDGSRLPRAWKPWLNVTERAQCLAMAARKFAQDNAGIRPGNPPATVTVYDATEDPTETLSCLVNFTTFTIYPPEQ